MYRRPMETDTVMTLTPVSIFQVLLSTVDHYQKTIHHKFYDQQSSLQNMEDLRNYALALVVEQAEFLQETNFKPWHYAEDRPVDRSKAAQEWIDILVFLLDQALCLKFTAEELADALNATLTKLMKRKEYTP